LPSLAALAARKDQRELEKTYAFGVRLTLFVAIAATALFVGLSEPIVALLFQRGKFDALAAHETGRALVAQGLGIWMVAVVRQLVSVYFAIGDTRTPVIVSLIDFAAFVALALALRGPFGHVGIGLAVTGSSAVQVSLLFAGLGRHLGSRHAREIAASAARTLCAAVAGAAAGRGVVATLSSRVAGGAAGTLVFVGVFLGAAYVLGSDELKMILDVVRRRVRRGRS
jgi:putative peptidoglycan lipid II flippase